MNQPPRWVQILILVLLGLLLHWILGGIHALDQ